MNSLKIGMLHPGEMGISLAFAAQNSGHRLYWASEGRSDATRTRAEEHGLEDVDTVAALCATCDVLICICPPHAAESMAQQVIDDGFRGLYVDANAIAPQRAQRIGAALAAAGIMFVDGGIIGGPAWKPGQTWLYLSGPQAADAAAYFAAGPLATKVVGDAIGRASALKMCYAAYTKGSTALLAALLAAAEQLDVRAELEQHWAGEDADFGAQVAQRIRGATAKAWRFTGEMHEIAATFAAVGLPGEFHEAAATIYERLAPFKAAAPPPTLDAILAALPADRADAP